MRVLGICHDVLICSACVVEDGEVKSAIAEERLDRVKQSRVFPALAIQRCLEESGLSLAQMDEIAVAWNPGIELETMPRGYLNARRWRSEHLSQVPGQLLRASRERARSLLTQGGLFEGCPDITYLDHYLAHVGNAVYLSPYDSCAVLILDGRGEKQTALLARAEGTRLEKLEEVNYPHSLGLFYGTVTQFLGFRPDSEEWKVMALASFGARGEQNPFLEPMRRLVQVEPDGTFRLELDQFAFYDFWDRRMFSDRFLETFGAPRGHGEELTSRHQDLAAAMQQVFEETVDRILEVLHRRTGEKRLAVSGGCFMNSVYNGRITASTPFDECFISSCPDDSGTSVGAALYLCAQRTGARPAVPPRHNYWGSGFSDEECLETVRKFKLRGEPIEEPSRRAARDLSDGKLVGWFQGRAEFGQRALGNRSILADPRRPEAKDLINAAVKYRESFRPFAPAVLAERVVDYFDCPAGTRVPYMERVLPVWEAKRAEVPAVVHVDGSGRLQTVDDATSPRFHALIRAFADLTGVPVVLNTSFNLNGEPIVDSPGDAIRTFHSCGLDVLYLGNVRLEK